VVVDAWLTESACSAEGNPEALGWRRESEPTLGPMHGGHFRSNSCEWVQWINHAEPFRPQISGAKRVYHYLILHVTRHIRTNPEIDAHPSRRRQSWKTPSRECPPRRIRSCRWQHGNCLSESSSMILAGLTSRCTTDAGGHRRIAEGSVAKISAAPQLLSQRRPAHDEAVAVSQPRRALRLRAGSPRTAYLANVRVADHLDTLLVGHSSGQRS
jgi:hypothetical protein